MDRTSARPRDRIGARELWRLAMVLGSPAGHWLRVDPRCPEKSLPPVGRASLASLRAIQEERPGLPLFERPRPAGRSG